MKFFTLVCLVVLLATTDGTMRSRFRGIKCSSFNNSIVSLKCGLKAYSRTYVVANMLQKIHLQIVGPVEVNIYQLIERKGRFPNFCLYRSK